MCKYSKKSEEEQKPIKMLLFPLLNKEAKSSCKHKSNVELLKKK